MLFCIVRKWIVLHWWYKTTANRPADIEIKSFFLKDLKKIYF